jgi:CBS domain-containing protein
VVPDLRPVGRCGWRLIGDDDINGLPVVDDSGRVVGIVTEAVLVSREAYGTERRRPLGLVLDYRRGCDPAWVRRASGATARELMTCMVSTVAPDDDLGEAAHRMVEGGHKRLPVVAAGRLVGIVSRRDLLAGAYAARKPAP